MPNLSPRYMVAVLLRRIASFAAAARSRYARAYLALAYPQIRVEHGVILQPGTRLRAYDGGSVLIGAGT